MAIQNASKEQAALAAAWKNSKPASQGRLSNVEWADGKYQFEVTTWEPEFAKARIKAGYTIIGGNESYIGQEHLQYENLTGSEDSLGYFKGRLVNMGIPEDDFADLEPKQVLGDKLKSMVLGRKFVGQVKTKNDYTNVYANSALDGDDANETEATTDAEEATEEAATELAEGARVSFTSKKDGELEGVIESVEDGTARVKADNDKTYKLPVDRFTVIAPEATEEAAEETVEEEVTEEAEETTDEAPAKGKAKIPAPKLIQAMRAPELKQLYAKLGIKFEAVKQPRELAVGIAGFVHDKKYMPSIALLPALSTGLGVKTEKGAKPAAVVAALRQKALAKFS
jgi:hypothetical protein